jgi:single-strand DNA-binding protein
MIEMASINKVMIMGRLGQDPELRYTPNQVPVCTMNVATTDFRVGPDGQRTESTEWHRVIAWQKTAENCAKYLTKGRGIFVEGRLQTRSWDDKSGQKRYTTEIIATNVQFLPASREAGASVRSDDYLQDAGGSFPQADLGGGSAFGGPETASLDDIPF